VEFSLLVRLDTLPPNMRLEYDNRKFQECQALFSKNVATH
jgi:hypothetical protein